MITKTCPKCGKKLNPQRSFEIYQGSNGAYYDYKVISFAKSKEERGIHGIFNAPKDIKLKMVNVGFNCIDTIRAEIRARDGRDQEVTRKVYAPNTY